MKVIAGDQLDSEVEEDAPRTKPRDSKAGRKIQKEFGL
jgi:hypothetical protein